MPPQNSCPVQRVQTYLALRSYMSIQASCLTMSNEQQARRILTAAANPAGGFVFAGEFYEACRCFLAGTDPSMPEKTLIHPNEIYIDRLLKLTPRYTQVNALSLRTAICLCLSLNDIERERFEIEKKRFEKEKEPHDIKIAEIKLKNVSAILRNPPASLSEAQLKRMRAQEVFLTGVVTGVDLDDDLEPATSAQRRKVGE
jgi:hypothetical protein